MARIGERVVTDHQAKYRVSLTAWKQ